MKSRGLGHKGEWLDLRLKNCNHKVGLYLEKLDALISKESVKDDESKVFWYKEVLDFYYIHLIPSMEEAIALDKKNLEIINLNPDPKFVFMRKEVNHHNELVNQFLQRFEEIRKEIELVLLENK